MSPFEKHISLYITMPILWIQFLLKDVLALEVT